MTQLHPYKGHWPALEPGVFVAPTASVIGRVALASQSNLWFGAVLRGDVEPIHVGARTNVQDNCVLHATTGLTPTLVGNDCTLGHGAILHGCSVGESAGCPNS